jgi:hypothetical protein
LQKHKLRKQQWEIGESLVSCLQNGKVLTGNVSEIIASGGIRANGHSVGKFLQRAESMQRTPFQVQRTHISDLSIPRCVYRFKLRDSCSMDDAPLPPNKGKRAHLTAGGKYALRRWNQ